MEQLDEKVYAQFNMIPEPCVCALGVKLNNSSDLLAGIYYLDDSYDKHHFLNEIAIEHGYAVYSTLGGLSSKPGLLCRLSFEKPCLLYCPTGSNIS